MKELLIPVFVISFICTVFFLWQLVRWRGLRFWLAIVAVPTVALCFCPLLPRYFPQAQSAFFTVAVWLGNCWVAMAGIFTLLMLLIELARAVMRAYFKCYDGQGSDVLPPRRSVPLALILLVLVCGYGVFEAQNVQVKHLAIQTDKLPQGLNNYRVVFISDLHLNALNGPKMLECVTNVIKEQKADILLFGGDIVSDHNMKRRQKEAAMLAGAMPPHGSFGVLGNHEAYYDHYDNSIPFLKRAWVHVMRGEAIATDNLFLVGVDDPEVANMQGSTVHDPMLILERMPQERFVILLKHRPEIQQESIGLFDLQLSGHTHGGQIWPVKHVLELIFKTPQAKLAKFESPKGTSWYYCTTGVGFSTLPMRLFTPPEVVVIDLLR